MSQFDDEISARIQDLHQTLGSARAADDCAEDARIECELADLRRLRRENRA